MDARCSISTSPAAERCAVRGHKGEVVCSRMGEEGEDAAYYRSRLRWGTEVAARLPSSSHNLRLQKTQSNHALKKENKQIQVSLMSRTKTQRVSAVKVEKHDGCDHSPKGSPGRMIHKNGLYDRCESSPGTIHKSEERYGSAREPMSPRSFPRPKH